MADSIADDLNGSDSGRDMSQYIRTYAKDVARITNQPQPAATTPSRTPADDVTLPEADASPVNRPDGIARAFPQETLTLSEEDSEGVFANNRPAPRPLTPPTQLTPPPTATPTAVPSAASAIPAVTAPVPTPPRFDPAPVPPPAAPQKSHAEERDAILARLREKVAQGGAAKPASPPPAAPLPTPAPPPPPTPQAPILERPPEVPVFVAPRPTPPAPPMPDPTPPPVPAPPAPVEPPQAPVPLPVARTYIPPARPIPQSTYTPPPQPAPAYVPPPIPTPPPERVYAPPPGVVPLQKNAAQPNAPQPFHSYTTDFSDRMATERASPITVVAAQQDQGTRTRRTPAKRRGLVPAVLAVLLIVLGGGGLYAAINYADLGSSKEETLGVPSLILADEKMELQGPDYRRELADAANQPLVEGNILVTYVTSASTTKTGLLNAPQPGGALIRLLNLGAPDILMRNVDLASTVGVVSTGEEAHPFFILRVNSFERTFAGMLGWESTMFDDLNPLYPLHMQVAEPQPVETTGTSTPILPPMPLNNAPQGFTDDVIANRDVRVLRDGAGRTLLLYGYSDKETLVIARDELAFATLVARLTATQSQ